MTRNKKDTPNEEYVDYLNQSVDGKHKLEMDNKVKGLNDQQINIEETVTLTAEVYDGDKDVNNLKEGTHADEDDDEDLLSLDSYYSGKIINN